MADIDAVPVALIAVLGVLAIVLGEKLAPRLRVATPLVLVALGVAVSFIPAVPAITVDPDLILAGVLPPLLYASAVRLPAMEFRRDLTAIGGLSVVLVILSSLALGGVLTAVVPGIPLSVGIALGAILSPTDAVATTIIRRLGVSPRIVTVLEGESLFNDATSLVIMGVAISAAGSPDTVSAGGIVWKLVYSIAAALVIGALVGTGGLRFRRWLHNAPLSTLVSFTAPFVAYLAAEELGTSGLVAVATAGLVAGNGAARQLDPTDRMAEAPTWRSVSLLLEGGVFLAMGLELFGLVEEVRRVHESLWSAAGLAALAVLVVLAVRGAFIGVLLRLLGRRARRRAARRERARAAVDRLRDPDGSLWELGRGAAPLPQARLDRLRLFLARTAADIDYLTEQRLGPREGVLLVWAGMRGVVTLAAAQSLPTGTPQRALLVLVAFLVAAGTLVLQGATLPWLTRRLALTRGTDELDAERAALRTELDTAALGCLDEPGLARSDGSAYDPVAVARARRDLSNAQAMHAQAVSTTPERFAQYRELRLRAIQAEREALTRARDAGRVSSRTLREALAQLDAEQIEIRARRGPVITTEDEEDDADA
ncbi:cation:proton antiporter [Schaalia naturae]|uniref:Cation:proton antiporter n=2 Tax=Schaalia naturae TaxID=635203 RepID=A0ABW2SKJ4_9ACTO